MNYIDYISLVQKRLNKISGINFIYNANEMNVKIDLYATSVFSRQNFLENRLAPFNKYEINEKYYLKHFENITVNELKSYFNFLYMSSIESIPTYQHLYKCIIGVMICDSIDESCKILVKKLNHNHFFSMCFKGWSEISLILVDLNCNSVYFNNSGKNSSELFAIQH